jgi:phage tail protein X
MEGNMSASLSATDAYQQKERLVTHALLIAEALDRHALWAAGNTSWLGSPSLSQTPCSALQPIGDALHGGLPALDTPQVRHDIERAFQRTRQAGVQALDALCWGNMGRVAFLLTAAQQFADAGLADLARHALGGILTHAEQTGAFALDRHLPAQVHQFGFF